MTRIAPPLPAFPLGQHGGQGGGQSALVTVSAATGALARLQTAAIVEGVVTGRDAGGATLLRTSQGTLSLPLFPPPAQGSTVTLEIQTLGNQMRAAVLSIRPPAGQPSVPVAGAAPGTAGAPTIGTAGNPTIGTSGAPTIGTPGAAAPGAGGSNSQALPGSGPHVQAQPGAPPPAVPATPAATPPPPVALALSQDWPALRMAIDTLATSSPQAAQALQSVLPGPNAALPAAMLLFMNALGRGDLRGVLGREAFRELRAAGDGALVDRLSADLGEIARTAAEPRPDGFRLFLIPVHDGARLEQIRLLVRDHEEEHHTIGGREGPATRFVFDVTFSRLGHMQLDGIASDGHLDLMIRSVKPLPRDLRAEIAGMFTESREALGMGGDVAFQVTRDFPVDPAAGLEDAVEHHAGFVV